MSSITRSSGKISRQKATSLELGTKWTQCGWVFANLAVRQNHFGIPFWLVGKLTTHLLVRILVGIGMFTEGTIWILTHGHLGVALVFGSIYQGAILGTHFLEPLPYGRKEIRLGPFKVTLEVGLV